MIALLVIADDFTGALDTAVQINKSGIKTIVTTDIDIDLTQEQMGSHVVVIDAETRHLATQKAKERVSGITGRALAAGIPNIYKKTDSSLRGNVGGELEGMMQSAGGAAVLFVPAFPQIGRITKGGTQYIDSVPIQNTVFAQDPFQPVKSSFLPDILAQQTQLPVKLLEAAAVPRGQWPKGVIMVVDACSAQDLELIAEACKSSEPPRLLAGCAGFGEMLPCLLLDTPRQYRPVWNKTKYLFAVSGSVNPISIQQAEYAGRHGFLLRTLTPEEKLCQSNRGDSFRAQWRHFVSELVTAGETRILVRAVQALDDLQNANQYAEEHGVDAEQLRRRVSNLLGSICAEAADTLEDASFVLVGGDTLFAFLKELGCDQIIPLGELLPGVVLSVIEQDGRRLQVVSKSGGFGGENTLTDIAQQLLE